MLRLGVPSKGRLQEETIAWFAARGIAVARGAGARVPRHASPGIDGVELVLLVGGGDPGERWRPGGCTSGSPARTWCARRSRSWAERLEELAPMGFGFADLVVAVPAFWVDVTEMADLDAAAAQFRARHGHRLRVATKYRHLVRAFFQRHGVANYLLVDSQGATEGAVKNGTAEAVADITTTGATLRDNHLRVLEDGLILRSQATLFLARGADREGSAGDDAGAAPRAARARRAGGLSAGERKIPRGGWSAAGRGLSGRAEDSHPNENPMTPIETAASPRTMPRFAEFVAMMALLMALTALSIDVMLPALPLIRDEFGLDRPEPDAAGGDRATSSASPSASCSTDRCRTGSGASRCCWSGSRSTRWPRSAACSPAASRACWRRGWCRASPTPRRG